MNYLTGAVDQLAATPSTGVAYSSGYKVVSDATISNATIDNAGFYYLAGCSIPAVS